MAGTLTPGRRSNSTTITTRRKHRRDFLSLVAASALAVALTVLVWRITGAGSFWPMWVVFGLGIAVMGSAWRAFSPSRSSGPDDP